MKWGVGIKPPEKLTVSQLNAVVSKLHDLLHNVAVDIWHDARDNHDYKDAKLNHSVRYALGKTLDDVFVFHAENFGIGQGIRSLPDTPEELRERLEQFFRGMRYAVKNHVADETHKEYLMDPAHMEFAEKKLAELKDFVFVGLDSQLAAAKEKSR